MTDEKLFEANVNASVDACMVLLRQVITDPDVHLFFGEAEWSEQERRRYEIQIRLTRGGNTVPVGSLIVTRLSADRTLLQIQEVRYTPVARITEERTESADELSQEFRTVASAAVRAVRDAVLERFQSLQLLSNENRGDGLAMPGLGERVKEARIFKGWSLSATGDLLGGDIDPVRLKGIEEGSVPADPRLWGRLWVLFGLPLHQLYHGVGLPVPDELPTGLAGEIWSLVRTQPPEVQRLILGFARYAPALVGAVLSAASIGSALSSKVGSNGEVAESTTSEPESLGQVKPARI